MYDAAVESWSKIVCNHPDYVSYEAKQMKLWETTQAAQVPISCLPAHPPTIFETPTAFGPRGPT